MSSTISISVGGSNLGQIAASDSGNIEQTQQIEKRLWPKVITVEEARAELRKALPDLDRDIAAKIPAENKKAAVEQAEAMKAALLDEKTDEKTVSKLAGIRKWFADHAPQVLGTVTGLIVNPLVGKLVEAAGELVAEAFKKQFGPVEDK